MFNLMPRRERGEVAVRNPFEWFRREFASLFDRAFPAFPVPFEPLWENNWGFEMETREKEYVVRAEVPGFEASEFEVTFAGNMLTIRAEHKPVAGKEETVERSMSRLVVQDPVLILGSPGKGRHGERCIGFGDVDRRTEGSVWKFTP
jgi:HSP20 family molecular chaperone IbpA